MVTRKNKLKVKLPAFIARYPSVFQPSTNEWEIGKHSITCVFPPETDLARLRVALDTVSQKWGDVTDYENPLKPQNKEWCDFYGDSKAHFCRCRSNFKPKVVDQNFQPIINPEDFPEGVLAECIVELYPWEQFGKRGISLSLGTIRRLQDPDEVNTEYYSPISPADEFAQFDEDSE